MKERTKKNRPKKTDGSEGNSVSPAKPSSAIIFTLLLSVVLALFWAGMLAFSGMDGGMSSQPVPGNLETENV